MIRALIGGCVALAAFGGAYSAKAAAPTRPQPEVFVVSLPKGGQPVAAATDSRGVVHVLFNSKDGPQYVSSSDGGKTLSEPIAVVDRASRKPGLEFTAWSMAVAPDGRVHAALGTNAWKLKLPKEEWSLHYTSLAPGAKEFSPVRNLNHKPSEGFSLAADGEGNVTACWLSGKLYANVSIDAGKTFGPAVEIDASFDPCDCCTTAAAYGADGKLAVLYREETANERDMFLVLWDQKGKAVSRTAVSRTSWKTDSCPMSHYALVPRNRGFTAVWPTKGQVCFARLDEEGALASRSDVKTPGTAGMRTGMVSLSLADDNTLVAWNEKEQLKWQIYDKDDRPIGPPESIATTGAGVAGVVTERGEGILFR